jgi:hypothetical protein
MEKEFRSRVFRFQRRALLPRQREFRSRVFRFQRRALLPRQKEFHSRVFRFQKNLPVMMYVFCLDLPATVRLAVEPLKK